MERIWGPRERGHRETTPCRRTKQHIVGPTSIRGVVLADAIGRAGCTARRPPRCQGCPAHHSHRRQPGMGVQGHERSGIEAVKSACLLPDVERPGGSVLWARRRTWLYESGATAAKCWLLGETGYIRTGRQYRGGQSEVGGSVFFCRGVRKSPIPTRGGRVFTVFYRGVRKSQKNFKGGGLRPPPLHAETGLKASCKDGPYFGVCSRCVTVRDSQASA